MDRAPGTAAETASTPSYRLDRKIEPVTYRIELRPDLDAASFRGHVAIDVVVHEATPKVVLNAAELEIDEAAVTTPGGSRAAASVELDAASERATLTLAEALQPGPATIDLSFTGVLNDQLHGFYKSSFVDESGEAHTIATTQMEATDARRAFPCWDEPDRKAVFCVTLVVDDGLAAYSNSPVEAESIETADGRRVRRVRFSPTMKMSTYLVAFIVGTLEATGAIDVSGVPVRVVHVPGKGHLCGFALDVARHALDFFTDYFGIPYPGEKLDLVAIPDFAHGAMENLGCVTFREAALLVDPHTAARVELERIADVVHHEIAHMWFGDLVTMGWWEGIWLNEAFATFMEMLATDDFRPGWDRWTTFGVDRDASLSVDGLHTTRPIEYAVGSPEEVGGMFDVLTYTKGSSVLRMLEQYLGRDVFRDGVRRYLEAHAYANTVTSDLWDALEAVSGEPVRAVADTWILQGGYPLVALDGDTLTQEPFSYLPDPSDGVSAIGKEWLVPVVARSGAGSGPIRTLLGSSPATVADATFLNAGGWGVYRVAYPREHMTKLAAKLPTMSALERFVLFSDTWALVLAGRRDLAELLEVATHLGNESEPGVWRIVVSALAFCARVARDSERPLVEAASRALLGKRAAALGWEPVHGEGERVPTLRALLISALGTIGATPVVRQESARRFDEWKGGARIDPDIHAAVLEVVADQARDGDYLTVVERYRHPSDPLDERRHLMALGLFSDAGCCLESFELARTDIRPGDGPILVNVLLANREGGVVVWDRVRDHWDELTERYPDVLHSRMVSSARTLFADPAVAADVRTFLGAHPVAIGERTVAQTLEQLEVRTRLAERVAASGGLAHTLSAISTH